jgi:hypothetical protein
MASAVGVMIDHHHPFTEADDHHHGRFAGAGKAFAGNPHEEI